MQPGGFRFTVATDTPRSFPQEQYLRDCKITHIYEGTNGIQAMDLLGRKLAMNQGRAFSDLIDDVRKTVAAASRITVLGELATEMESTVRKLEKTARHIGVMATSENMLTGLCPCLCIHGRYRRCRDGLDAALAGLGGAPGNWKKGAGGKRIGHSYEGQVAGARFFIRTVLPVEPWQDGRHSHQ